MIRPFTFICMLLAGGAGLYLYTAKHEAQLLDREIAHTVHLADIARARAGVLQAEYTRLNDPQRLAELAADHLPALRSTQPPQFTTWAELEKHLPPVGAPAAEAPPLEPDAPGAKLPEPKPDVVRPEGAKVDGAKVDGAKADGGKPREAEPDAARPIAAATPAPAVAMAATAATPPHHPPAARPAAATRPAPAAAGSPRPAPVSLTASLQTPARPSSAAPAPQPVAVAAIATRPATLHPATLHGGASDPQVAAIPASAPVAGSSLGMARTISAPAPVGHIAAPAVWRPAGDYPQAGTQ